MRDRRDTYHPLLEITLARVREFVREPEAVFWVFVFPVLLALALGIAFRDRPPEKLAVAVDDRVPNSAGIMGFLSASGEIDPKLLSAEEIVIDLRGGKIDLAVSPGEGAPDGDAPAAEFLYLYDPSRPNGRLAALSVDDAIQSGMGRRDAVRVRWEKSSAPGSRYIDFLIPGLIGLNLMASGMWGIGFNVVDARTKKLLKLLTATPMRRSHFLLGFQCSRLVFLIIEVVALVGFGWLVFDVRVRGSFVSLGLVLLAGAGAFAGLGLLVAARPRTIEAVSGWMNFVMLPMWLLSGSFFSYSRFPEFMQPLIRLLPLTALNDALRLVINEGAPLLRCGPELAVLCVWAIACFALALKIFRWQ